jgi:hypothetical protein
MAGLFLWKNLRLIRLWSVSVWLIRVIGSRYGKNWRIRLLVWGLVDEMDFCVIFFTVYIFSTFY